jgi:hypothetical protein
MYRIAKTITRVGLLSVAVPALAFAATLPAHAAAVPSIVKPMSSGGGCTTEGTEGDSVEACISASGTTVKSDGYFNKMPKCTTVTIFLEDTGTGQEWTHVESCGLGHHGPIGVTGVKGHNYRTVITVTEGGGNFSVSISPTLHLS